MKVYSADHYEAFDTFDKAKNYHSLALPVRLALQTGQVRAENTCGIFLKQKENDWCLFGVSVHCDIFLHMSRSNGKSQLLQNNSRTLKRKIGILISPCHLDVSTIWVTCVLRCFHVRSVLKNVFIMPFYLHNKDIIHIKWSM